MKDKQKIEKNFETNQMEPGTLVINPDGTWELLAPHAEGRAMFRNLTTNKRSHYANLKLPVILDEVQENERVENRTKL